MRLIRSYNSATGMTDVYEVLDEHWNGEMPLSPERVRLFGYVDPDTGAVAPLKQKTPDVIQKAPDSGYGQGPKGSRYHFPEAESGTYIPPHRDHPIIDNGRPLSQMDLLRRQLAEKDEKISLLQWQLDDLKKQRASERDKLADVLEQLMKKLRAS